MKTLNKTEELKSKVNRTKSIKGLIALRKSTNNTRVIAHIKDKIEDVLLSKGYGFMNVSMSSLKNITRNTDTNDFSTVKIPKTNKAFKKYAGKTVKIYVNHKDGGKYQNAEVFVK